MTYIPGGVWFICDRCGEKKRRSQVAKEWTNLIVCRATCWDPRPPQLDAPEVGPEGLPIPDARPRPADIFVSVDSDDTTPSQFTFTDVTSASLSTVYTSNAITVAGINAAASISITGGSYSINGGSYVSSTGTVVNGDTVAVRGTSSGSFSTAVNVVLTIGGVSDTYSVTTLASDGTPDVFSFTDASGVELSTVTTSNTITVAGINTTAAISITGGTYSKNGGAFTAVTGTAVLGDTVAVKGTSSGSYLTAVNVVLTIGGVSDTFTITTKADPGAGFTPTFYFLGF